MVNLNGDALIKEAFKQEWAFRDATQQELLEFKKKLQQKILESKLDPEEIKNKLLEKFKKDKGLITSLNKALEPYSPGTAATWSLKTNKMLEIIDGTVTLINDNFFDFIKSIKSGDELPNYQIKTNQDDVTIMDNTQATIYGTSKGSFFKTLLINTYLVYTGKEHLSDIDFNTNKYWIDGTPNAHVTPLPNGLDPQTINFNEANFKECTYFYSDEKTPKGLAFTHSGYAFGGYRDEPRYPYPPGKALGPEDCSSWIGKLTLEVDTISTVDLWNRWKYQREGYSVSTGWEKTNIGKTLITQVTPLEITHPQQDIEPEQIWVSRSFNTNKDPEMKGDGQGGHIVLITEKPDANDMVKALGYHREMPKIEGFGLQSFPVYPDTKNKRILFFKVNPKILEPTLEEKPVAQCQML